MRRLALLIPLILAALLFGIAPDHAAAQTNTLTHTVQPGETLLELELFYGLTPQEFATQNAVIAIGTGDDLTVPIPTVLAQNPATNENKIVSYVVQRGDTLFRIATQFGVRMDDIANYNQLASYDRILVGQELKIPGSDYIPPTKEEILAHTQDPLPAEIVMPQPTVLEGKQVVVVLAQQRAYAFENGVLLRHFVVSTGLPATPTVIGDFKVYLKYEAQRMVGPGYDLPGVPWVLYFYQGYALHGTYWHNNFGHPMSHGCVNMRTPEAEWMYDWASIGTPVHVSWDVGG
jgi:LysM repeat protein